MDVLPYDLAAAVRPGDDAGPLGNITVDESATISFALDRLAEAGLIRLRARQSWWAATVIDVDYADAHPEGVTNIFVQWKGTDVCFDFWCECGAQGHFDGYFAYQVRCPKCEAVFAMPSTVYPLKLAAASTKVAGPIDVELDTEDDADA